MRSVILKRRNWPRTFEPASLFCSGSEEQFSLILSTNILRDPVHKLEFQSVVDVPWVIRSKYMWVKEWAVRVTTFSFPECVNYRSSTGNFVCIVCTFQSSTAHVGLIRALPRRGCAVPPRLTTGTDEGLSLSDAALRWIDLCTDLNEMSPQNCKITIKVKTLSMRMAP